MTVTVTELATDRDGRVRLALARSDAAAALGMSLKSFQRHVQPNVRCVYVGGLRLYPVADLQAWLGSQSCRGGRAAPNREETA